MGGETQDPSGSGKSDPAAADRVPAPRARKKKPSDRLKRFLSLRDGLYTWLLGPRGPIHLVRCSICARFVPGGFRTVGHRLARSRGGTNDPENLRIECQECNFADGRKLNQRPSGRATEMMRRRRATKERRRRERMTAAEATPPRPVFDNIPVTWNGRIIGYTSRRRAKRLVKWGIARLSGETGVDLLAPPRGGDRAAPLIPNECVRCAATKRLTRFAIYPPGHPILERPMRASDATRAVCEKCRFLFEIGYGAAITRAALPLVLRAADRLNLLVERHARAREAWNRAKSGAPLPEGLALRMKELTDVDPKTTDVQVLKTIARSTAWQVTALRRELRRRFVRVAAESGVDFAALFEQLRAFKGDPEEIALPDVPSAEVRVRARFL